MVKRLLVTPSQERIVDNKEITGFSQDVIGSLVGAGGKGGVIMGDSCPQGLHLGLGLTRHGEVSDTCALALKHPIWEMLVLPQFLPLLIAAYFKN